MRKPAHLHRHPQRHPLTRHRLRDVALPPRAPHCGTRLRPRLSHHRNLSLARCKSQRHRLHRLHRLHPAQPHQPQPHPRQLRLNLRRSLRLQRKQNQPHQHRSRHTSLRRHLKQRRSPRQHKPLPANRKLRLLPNLLPRRHLPLPPSPLILLNLLRRLHRQPSLNLHSNPNGPRQVPRVPLRCSAGRGRRSSRTSNRTAGSCGRSCSKTSRSPAMTGRRSPSGSAILAR